MKIIDTIRQNLYVLAMEKYPIGAKVIVRLGDVIDAFAATVLYYQDGEYWVECEDGAKWTVKEFQLDLAE